MTQVNAYEPIRLSETEDFVPIDDVSVPQIIPINPVTNENIKIYYLFDGEYVTYSQYIDRPLFNEALERNILIIYETDFNVTDLGRNNLYYKSPSSGVGVISFFPNVSS